MPRIGNEDDRPIIGFRMPDPEPDPPTPELDPVIGGMLSVVTYMLCKITASLAPQGYMRNLERALGASLEAIKPLAEQDDWRRGQMYALRGLLKSVRKIERREADG